MSKKKIYSIYLVLLFLMFCYGFLSHKNKIFPYQIIKFSKETLLNVYFKEINIKENKIRNKYKDWNKSNTNFKKIFIKKYYPGVNIFSDRNYFNHENDEKLKGLYLVQIPRHYQNNIYLNIYDEIIIYRVLCERNNNKKYTNWKKVNYKLAIIGFSCIHTDIIKKKVTKSVFKIVPGGPISSDPIFLYNPKTDKQIFELRN